jgi:purine-binding chemotaxis protein CheW
MNSEQNVQSKPKPADGATGKYMTFKLGAEEYGLEILKVRELIGLMETTRVPRAPEFIRGLINLRGKVIPVIDLRVKFGMQTVELSPQNVIIVVHIGSSNAGITMGILVDEVLEVRAIGEDEIEPPPNFQTQAVAEFIRGIGKADERIIILLDIDRVLTGAEALGVADVLG